MADFSRERELMAAGARAVCGVDEVGRGPLCGPVVVAAVRLDPDHIPDGLTDSKKLTAKRREALFELIVARAEIAIVAAPPALIDRLNIRGATLWAMARAVRALPTPADYALIDGRDVPPGLCCRGEALIKGDSRSASIAAASIVAKVTRDRMCGLIETDAPGYGVGGHMGYPTPAHFSGLDALGPSRHHRMSFAPCRAAVR